MSNFCAIFKCVWNTTPPAQYVTCSETLCDRPGHAPRLIKWNSKSCTRDAMFFFSRINFSHITVIFALRSKRCPFSRRVRRYRNTSEDHRDPENKRQKPGSASQSSVFAAPLKMRVSSWMQATTSQPASQHVMSSHARRRALGSNSV